MAFTGSIVNIVTFWTLLRSPSFRNSHYVLVLCVCAADIVLNVLLIPYELLQLMFCLVPSLFGCRFSVFIGAVAYSSSNLGQLLIACNRMKAVFAPVRFRTNHSTLRTISIWFIVGLSLPAFFTIIGQASQIENFVVDDKNGMCTEQNCHEVWAIVRMLLFAILPVGLSLICYIAIGIRLVIGSYLRGRSNYLDVLKRTRGSASMVACIVILGICMLMEWLDEKFDYVDNRLTRFLFHLSYAVNPVSITMILLCFCLFLLKSRIYCTNSILNETLSLARKFR